MLMRCHGWPQSCGWCHGVCVAVGALEFQLEHFTLLLDMILHEVCELAGFGLVVCMSRAVASWLAQVCYEKRMEGLLGVGIEGTEVL